MIDDVSLEILRILQDKARIPNVEVSRQIGLAPSAVLERIRKMEKQGIIDGYEVRLNPQRFASGQIAFVRVTVLEQPDQTEIGDQLAAVPEIQEVHYIAGEDCYLVKLRAADAEALGRLLRTTVHAIKGVVATSTLPVLATYKETARIPIP
jgi:Lrp/AsnC family leucine-responsive transcriptional regulator